MFYSLGHLKLLMYNLIVHANDLVIKVRFLEPKSNVTTKEELNSDRL